MKPLIAVVSGIVLFVSALVILVPTPADAGGAACAAAADQKGISNAPKGYEDVKQMIFFAVLEGMYRDGVSTEIATLLTSIDPESNMTRYFVYGCPLCMPAYDAIQVYKGRAPLSDKMKTDTFGDGLSEVIREQLAIDDPQVRVETFQALILDWVKQYQERRRLTPEEAQQWRRHLDGMREKGNALLAQYLKSGGATAKTYAGWEKCPACEGSNGAMNP